MFHYVDHDFAGPPVYFRRASAAIPPTSTEAIDHWSRVLSNRPEVLRIELRGHVEERERGSALARQRAESVAHALVAQGAAAARLAITGVDQPIPDDGTRAGKARNRCVHISILERRQVSRAGEQHAS
jgi:outer membrane protein OmpA-like peptidoglycan-associated protein